jgi:hypothetical protein
MKEKSRGFIADQPVHEVLHGHAGEKPGQLDQQADHTHGAVLGGSSDAKEAEPVIKAWEEQARAAYQQYYAFAPPEGPTWDAWWTAWHRSRCSWNPDLPVARYPGSGNKEIDNNISIAAEQVEDLSFSGAVERELTRWFDYYSARSPKPSPIHIAIRAHSHDIGGKKVAHLYYEVYRVGLAGTAVKGPNLQAIIDEFLRREVFHNAQFFE